MSTNHLSQKIRTSIAPFLVVKNCAAAIQFYVFAMGATETHHYESSDGRVSAELNIGGAVIHVGDEEEEYGNLSPDTVGGTAVRIVLTVSDPDTIFSRALQAGAEQICPVTTEDSWKIGKLKDPFGHIWEIGHPLS